MLDLRRSDRVGNFRRRGLERCDDQSWKKELVCTKRFSESRSEVKAAPAVGQLPQLSIAKWYIGHSLY
jgi:hypothetical protein